MQLATCIDCFLIFHGAIPNSKLGSKLKTELQCGAHFLWQCQRYIACSQKDLCSLREAQQELGTWESTSTFLCCAEAVYL